VVSFFPTSLHEVGKAFYVPHWQENISEKLWGLQNVPKQTCNFRVPKMTIFCNSATFAWSWAFETNAYIFKNLACRWKRRYTCKIKTIFKKSNFFKTNKTNTKQYDQRFSKLHLQTFGVLNVLQKHSIDQEHKLKHRKYLYILQNFWEKCLF